MRAQRAGTHNFTTFLARAAHSPPRPSNMDSKNAIIHQLYVSQRFDKCRELLDRVLTDSGGRAEYALHVKALIERQNGRIQESLKLFQQAMALNPHNIANLKQVARSWFLLGKHKAALEVYDEALKLDGNDWELWFSKGRCAAQARDHDRALECFRQANAIQPHDATFMQIGALHTERGELEEALHAYLEGLEHSPDNPELLTTLGVAFLRLGDNQRAFDHLGTSLMHDPRNFRTILATASIIQDHQDVDVALVKYRVASAACPTSPQLWNNIGLCFFSKQRYIAAAACLKRALYLGPLEWVAAYNLGLVHLATGQAASALHYLGTAANLKPDFAHSYMYLGVALARLGDRDNASAAFAKAASMEPGEPLVHLNHAIVLHNAGDAAGARCCYDECRRRLDGEGATFADADAAHQADVLGRLLGGVENEGGAQ